MRLLPAWQQLRLDKADSLAKYSTLADLAKVRCCEKFIRSHLRFSFFTKLAKFASISLVA
jgi:hypothetical protein